MQEPGMIESLSKNITRQGLTNTTLNYLRVRDFNQWGWPGEHIMYSYLPLQLQFVLKWVLHGRLMTETLAETFESGPLCITDLFQNMSVAYF